MDAALLWIGIFWWVWTGGCVHAWQRGTFDPVEAKAKAAMTANLSLCLLALLVHWTVALCFFINAFVMYFWVRSCHRDFRN